ncbi:MAG: hypothetical protein ACI9TY_000916 [Alphaproteobacteria bacterium]|jgi:hypothetical protein
MLCRMILMMKIYEKFRLFCLMVAHVTFFAVPCMAEPLSIQQAIHTALENNPDIDIASYRRNAQVNRIEAAKSGYFPQIDLDGGSG